jgi:hypothetical protein
LAELVAQADGRRRALHVDQQDPPSGLAGQVASLDTLEPATDDGR